MAKTGQGPKGERPKLGVFDSTQALRGDLPEIGTKFIQVEFQLTSEEIGDRAKDLSTSAARLEERKEAAAPIEAQIDQLKKKTKVLEQVLKTGKEYRRIQVRRLLDEARGCVHLVDMETGQEHGTEPIEDEDAEQSMGL